MTRWYIRGDLPPAGNRIVLDDTLPPPGFPGYSPHWLNSGTAALALALSIARANRPDVSSPEVLLPAYGCPDLVAAAEYARVQPVLVDIGSDDPGYSLAALEQALTRDVVAVVAVNFLGIAERLHEIKDLLAGKRALLIEDDAQWFPEPLEHPPLVGDLVCLSFGRGKPVSLLGGGALLVREGSGLQVPDSEIAAGAVDQRFELKARLFNLLSSRHWYWTVNRNPLISLGQTVFKPLTGIRTLDDMRSRCLGANVAAHLRHSRSIETSWAQALSSSGSVTALHVASERRRRLLRYPVLCRDAGARNTLLRQLHLSGLGVTAMYRRPLAEVSGVAGKVRLSSECPGAAAFAARLLTLPTHGQTVPDDLRAATLAMSA